MEGADREESRNREEEEKKDGNNSGDVTEEMVFFLAFCSIHSRFFLAFFIFLSPSHPLLVLVNKAVCVQTLLWYSPPSPSCPFPLSFLPLLFSGEIKAHTVTALTISPKNPPLQKSSKLPPSQAWAEWETLGCG